MRILSSSISALALATACMFASPAAAQTTAEPAPAQQPQADPAQVGVGEIVVTAQRRSENLQNVPVSVGIIDKQQLAAINTGGAHHPGTSGPVPGINIESSFGRTFPRFYIRGL